MKKLLVILTLFISLKGFSQGGWLKPNNSYGTISNRASIDSTLFFPTGCGTPSLRGYNLFKSAFFYDSCNKRFYVYDPKLAAWDTLHIGGGSSLTSGSGITINGSAIDLGGNLTQNAVINGVSTYNLTNTALNTFSLSTSQTGSNVVSSVGSTGLVLGGQSKSASTLRGSAFSLDTTQLVLRYFTNGSTIPYSINLFKDSLTILGLPQSVSSTDSVIVRTPSGQVKTISQATIADLITASNGLTKVVNDIQLGGTLTDDVSIAAANNQFEIDNASAITFQTNGTGEPIQLVQAAPFNSISIQDSLVLKPYLGIISIDTVKYVVSPYNTMLVWDSLRHNVSHVNIPTGTVTSVSAGYGMNFTTITSTGSVIADTSILVNKTGVQTLTNKRITPRVTTIASSSTPTPDIDASDMFTVTALAANATFAAPTGTPVNGQQLLIRILDNGTARTLAWNAVYRASTDFALPTTTVLSKTMYLQFIYNSASNTYDAVGYTNGF